MSVQPLIVAGLAFLLLREQPTIWRIGWGVAGMGGVAMMVLRGDADYDLVGIVAGIAGAASMASGIVLTKRWGRPAGVGLLSFTGWQLAAGGTLLVPLAVVIEGPPPALDASALGGYAWLAIVGTLLAYAMWFHGIGRLPVSAISFLGLLSPATATALGWLVLDQPLTPAQVVGFVVAMLSVLAAQLTPEAARSLLRPIRRATHPRSASPPRPRMSVPRRRGK